MNRSSPSPIEERQILESWEPEPLVPPLDLRGEDNEELMSKIKPPVVSSAPGKYITIDQVKCLNAACDDFLGLIDTPNQNEAAKIAARKYGVGSCGPRAFYGTMDIHLNLEKELASFLGAEEAILYSFGFATIASAIPAYAKASDIVYADEESNFSIQKGLTASRAKVLYFKHNDPDDLERLIKNVEEEQIKKYGVTNKVRSFIVIESIYAKTGELCPLLKIVELKKKHKIRLFIDESKSFGVLGSEGKGITQHFNVNVNDIDMFMVSLENALCGYGGFCAGSTFVIDHQRLAGSGYCFSASLPPLQAAVAYEALKQIKNDPSRVHSAQEMFQFANDMFANLTKLKNLSHPLSPFKILVFKSSYKSSESDSGKQYNNDHWRLRRIHESVRLSARIATCLTFSYIDREIKRPRASLRVSISGSMNHDDIKQIFNAIEKYSTKYIETKSS